MNHGLYHHGLCPCQLAALKNIDHSKDDINERIEFIMKCKVIDKSLRALFELPDITRELKYAEVRILSDALSELCNDCEYKKELENIREDIKKQGK